MSRIRCVVQRLLVHGGVQEQGHEVVVAGLRLAAASLQHLHPVLPDPAECRPHRLLLLEVTAEAREEVLHPRDEQISVGVGHADDGQEDLGGQAHREIGDEVALPPRREVGDETPADLVRLRGNAADCVGSEPSTDQLPVLGVLRRVDLGRDEPVRRLRVPRRDRLAGEDLRVLVHLADLVVPREHPVALGVGVEERGADLAKLVGLQPVAARLKWGGSIQVDDWAAAGHPLGGLGLLARCRSRSSASSNPDSAHRLK